jgi:hypothetical protein
MLTTRQLALVILFISGAALSWGVYIPTVHEAAGKLQSSLRAFLLVGIAYFLVAVLIPGAMLFAFDFDPTVRGTSPNFKPAAVGWGIAAGSVGAMGALCVILATAAGGKGAPLYVAPLVFAGVPIVNTIATITWFHPVKTLPDARFFLGLVMAAAGAVMVLVFKPTDAPARAPAPVGSANSGETAH